jgi:hypothetical protein
MVEANGTLEPTHDSGKSDRADGAVIVIASRWLGLLVFLVVIVLLLGRLLLSCLLPKERDKPCIKDWLYLKSSRAYFSNS